MAAPGPAARTIGILLVHRTPRDVFAGRRARVGTMAEIKRMNRGDDGAVTAITKGRQRFWVSHLAASVVNTVLTAHIRSSSIGLTALKHC